MFPLHALQVVEKLKARKGVKLTKMCHLFSLEISFFEILANFGVIFMGEGVEVAKRDEEHEKENFKSCSNIKSVFT